MCLCEGCQLIEPTCDASRLNNFQGNCKWRRNQSQFVMDHLIAEVKNGATVWFMRRPNDGRFFCYIKAQYYGYIGIKQARHLERFHGVKLVDHNSNPV